MAGGLGSKMNPKFQKILKNGSNSEIYKESPSDYSSPKPTEKKVFTLSGILGLGQSIEINKKSDSLVKSGENVTWTISHLEKEQKMLFDNRQAELQKSIDELRGEIKKLLETTNDLEKDIEKAAIDPVIEVSEYQINFFNRIRKFIAGFRQNMAEAGAWLETFNSKKKKKNAFWNNARNKKTGGEQYMFSDEHSVARSAT
jgi:hypothetical protein